MKSDSSKAAFDRFLRLSEVIKMDVLWAEGYRVDSVSSRDLQRFMNYIESQGRHHHEKLQFRKRQDEKKVDYGDVATEENAGI